MAHMFKGPGALTSGSVITNASNISVTDLTINNASDNNVEITDDVVIGGDLTTTTGDITATSITANIEEKITKLITTSSGANYGTIDVSNTNILYFADTTRTANIQLTATITWPTVRDGHRLFIAWTKRGGPNVPSIKIDFGADKILHGFGTNGPQYRYMTLSGTSGLGQNGILYYSQNLNAWLSFKSNGSTYSTS
jgi:hypothetical protein